MINPGPGDEIHVLVNLRGKLKMNDWLFCQKILYLKLLFGKKIVDFHIKSLNFWWKMVNNGDLVPMSTRVFTSGYPGFITSPTIL